MKARILSLLILIAGMVAIFSLSRSTYSLLRKGDLFVQKEKELFELRRKNEKLKKILKKVQDPEFIEKEAREKLNMGKKGEVVVVLPEERQQITDNKKKEDLPNWQKWYKLFFSH